MSGELIYNAENDHVLHLSHLYNKGGTLYLNGDRSNPLPIKSSLLTLVISEEPLSVESSKEKQ